MTFLVWSTATPIGLVIARPPFAGPVSIEVDEPVDPATVARGSGSDDYFTGFEPEEGFIARDPNFPTSGFSGWINGQPWNPDPTKNWETIPSCGGASQIEGHVNRVHAFSGQQHLRLTKDSNIRPQCCAFTCGQIGARIPPRLQVPPQPPGPYITSVDVAISALNGPNFRIQPQSNSQGLLSTSVLLGYNGAIYVLDDECGANSLQFWPTGFSWDTTGAYQPMSIEMDPCADTVNYFYGGQQIYSSCPIAGTALEQFLVFGDNYSGSHLDLDNVSLTRGEPCCGNGVIDVHLGEECDSTDDSLCPGLCQPDCRCGGPRGACCDTNGPDQGCTEARLEGECNGSDRLWFDGLECAEILCSCIPQCDDRHCGGDGCEDSCGDCDDGIRCNGMESCNEVLGQCESGVELSCSDGNVCNGIEFCDEDTGQCRPGAPLVCSDGNACNGIEVCNHVVQGCLPGTPPICDDGLFCNGLEYCQSPFGCAPGQPPCSAAEFCDESNDECRQPIIPAASAWGLTVLALALLIGGKIHFGRKPFNTG